MNKNMQDSIASFSERAYNVINISYKLYMGKNNFKKECHFEMEVNEKVCSYETNISKEMFEKTRKVIPGGVNANIKYFDPHPIVMEKAKGSHLFDVDGNEYIDYLLCYGALILGHGHPIVMDAVQNQLATCGTSVFGAPHEIEHTFANEIISAIPSVEMVRFTNSGLEATLLAIRLAQSFTGKTTIAKFEGHYHGGYDQVLISVNPDLEEAGSEKRPNPVPESKGMPKDIVEQTIVLPFNDIDATETILKENKHKIAAVIMEPIQGGFIPADDCFMHRLRKITEQLGIILIFDEVKTGFRITYGGVQNLYGIRPDITALGKVLGGGFPIGAVGGREEIMLLMDPNNGKDIFSYGETKQGKDDVLFHSGTYNGHPTILAAGLATLTYLKQKEVMHRLVTQTSTLKSGLENVYEDYHIPMKAVGMGSIFNIVLTSHPVHHYRDIKKANLMLRRKIDEELLRLGIYTKPLNRYSLSTVHDDQDIEYTIHAHETAIRRVLKII